VTECAPTDGVELEKVAVPPERVPVPSDVAPSVHVIVPETAT
jgi:hypothetical protein